MATRSVTTPSKFDNLSDAALADDLGALDCQAKALAERMKEIKAELDRRGIDQAVGDEFTVTKSEAVRWNLDLTAAKKALGEAWCTAHSKVAAVTSFRISVNRAALAAAA